MPTINPISKSKPILSINKLTEPLEILRAHHPLVIEGMSGYDHRDPEPIASHIVERLSYHWQANPLSKPVALVTQGDPIEKEGISAITRLVSDQLCLPRFMIHLDPHTLRVTIWQEADQYRVKLKVPYSTLLAHLALVHRDSEHLLIEE